MATTLTLVVTDGRQVALGHVGDSRGYLCEAGCASSPDHTYVQQLVEAGQLTPEARATHPWRNVVLRSVDGDPEGSGLDVVRLDATPGDRLMLCSDGLTDLVDDARIGRVLAPGRRRGGAVLTHLALDAGGRDNITVPGPRPGRRPTRGGRRHRSWARCATPTTSSTRPRCTCARSAAA